MEEKNKLGLKKDIFSIDDTGTNKVKTPKTTRIIIYLIILILLSFLLWAFFSNISISVTASGKVIGTEELQSIQNLEGGIIKKVYVKEGEVVKKNQLLVSLIDVGKITEYKKVKQKIAVLLIQIERLTAESNGAKTLAYPDSLKKNYPELVNQSILLFKANSQSLQEEIENLEHLYNLTKKELNLVEPMVKKRLISDIELIRIQKQLTQIRREILTKKNTSRNTAVDQLYKLKAELNILRENLLRSQDQLNRMEIRAPSDGVVHQIYLASPGEVVKPGDQIMSFMPSQQTLLIEAKLPADDIGFVKLGQKAEIQVSAYDFTVYGTLSGTLTSVSPNIVIDKEGQSFYDIKVKAKRSYLFFHNKKLYLVPGMNVFVKILTGKRKVLSYLLKPFLSVQETALQER